VTSSNHGKPSIQFELNDNSMAISETEKVVADRQQNTNFPQYLPESEQQFIFSDNAAFFALFPRPLQNEQFDENTTAEQLKWSLRFDLYQQLKS
jgi:hypothetical protein